MKPAKNDCGDDGRHPLREVQCEATLKVVVRMSFLKNCAIAAGAWFFVGMITSDSDTHCPFITSHNCR